MDKRLILLTAAALLAGCNKAQPSQPKAEEAPLSAAVDIPDKVIISTNEPFQTAEVIDGQIRLTTPDKPDGLMFEINAMASTKSGANSNRSWSADGPDGEIRVEASGTPCSDSMSGALFPFSGAITRGDTRTAGCARPAGTPMPGEGA